MKSSPLFYTAAFSAVLSSLTVSNFAPNADAFVPGVLCTQHSATNSVGSYSYMDHRLWSSKGKNDKYDDLDDEIIAKAASGDSSSNSSNKHDNDKDKQYNKDKDDKDKKHKDKDRDHDKHEDRDHDKHKDRDHDKHKDKDHDKHKDQDRDDDYDTKARDKQQQKDNDKKQQKDNDKKRETSVANLKKQLRDLSEICDRGLDANNVQQERARSLIFQLARYNPTKEPVKPYYTTTSVYNTYTKKRTATESNNPFIDDDQESLAGKWTLIWTDAPDITALNRNNLAKLGRIGQECDPPFIRNVIEWQQPEWARTLPLLSASTTVSSTPMTTTIKEQARILQKIVLSATATPQKPRQVDLRIAGLDIESDIYNSEYGNRYYDNNYNNNFRDLVRKYGLPVALLKRNPLKISQGDQDFRPPFGQFEVLYLDDELRVVRTSQNYYAVNERIQSEDDEWF